MERAIPEYDLFSRLEKLEKETKVGLSPRDSTVLGTFSMLTAFLALGFQVPEFARRYKDDTLDQLRKLHFNDKHLRMLERLLTDLCDGLENLGKV